MTHAETEIKNRSPQWLPAACVGTLGLAFYAFTCAPTVLWGDSATFAVRVARGELDSALGLALAHPLYILLARAFAALPLGDLAHRVNLFSGVCAAATLGLAASLASRLCSRRWAIAIALLMLGPGHTFWTHAVIAEVYSLYGLALLIELCLLERYFATGRRGWLAAALFANGLNLCNHLLATLHLPAYGLLVLWLLARRRLPLGSILLLAVYWLCGASLYIGMIAGHVAGGEPVGAVLREALTGSRYGGNIGGAAFAALYQAQRTAAAFALNFPTPILLLALPGIASLWRLERTRPLVAFMSLTCLVNLGFGYIYTVPDQYVFFFPCYVMIPLLIGVGADAWATSTRRRIACILLALLPTAAYEVAPPIARHYDVGLQRVRTLPGRDKYAYFLRPRKNGETGARWFGTAALRSAGPGGLLISDSTIQSLLVYLRDVEGVGREVALTDGDVAPDPPTAPVAPRAVAGFAASGRAYLCNATPRYYADWLHRDYDFRPAGPIFRLIARRAAAPAPPAGR